MDSKICISSFDGLLPKKYYLCRIKKNNDMQLEFTFEDKEFMAQRGSETAQVELSSSPMSHAMMK